MARKWDVVVIGAGGSQAQAMLRAAGRAGITGRWLAIDRNWRPEARAATSGLGIELLTMDPISDGARLSELLASTRVVANMAGPYYRTGLAVLAAAIASRTHYLDICDDADVTLEMLQLGDAARAAGVTALVGMGSSPGTTNVLIRAALDYLGPGQDVDIYWSVDAADLTDAALRHFWHCFNLVDPDGTAHPVPRWEALERRTVDFPLPVGPQTTVRLAHPEPITVPRFLKVGKVSNFGAISPTEALIVAWALILAADPRRGPADGSAEALEQAVRLFQRYSGSRAGAARTGSGMVIDIHRGGTGLRYSAGATTGMDDSTGIPAAAGVLMMLENMVSERGVLPPETLVPADFFRVLPRVSTGGGGLALHRLRDGTAGERLRIRDLFEKSEHSRQESRR